MKRDIKIVSPSDIGYEYSIGYESLYSTIRMTLGENAKLFAPIKINSTSIKWSTNDEDRGIYQSIVDAPDEIQGTLAYAWELRKKELSEQFAKVNSKIDLSKLLSVPDQSYVFYKINDNINDDIPAHQYSLLVTGWACYLSRKDKGTNVADGVLIEAKKKHQNVIVSMLDQGRKPLVNEAFTYVNVCKNISKSIQSDDKGLYQQGICLIGAKFSFIYQKTNQACSFEVLRGIELYELEYSPFTSAKVKVVNQNNISQVGLPLEISYGNQAWNVETDGLGEVEIDEILFQGNGLYLHVKVVGYLSRDFLLEVENAVFVMLIETKEPLKIRLKVVQDGEPIEKYSVCIEGIHTVNGTYLTDNAGIIEIAYLKEGDTFNVYSSEDPSLYQLYTVIDEQEEYLFELPREKKTVVVKILQVVDASNLAVSYYSLQLSANGVVSTVTTNEEGYVLLPKEWKESLLFEVQDLKTQTSEKYVIADQQEKYIFQLPKETEMRKIHLKVIQDGNPVEKYSICIEGMRAMNGTYLTDVAGVIEMTYLKGGDTFNAYSSEDPSLQQLYTVIDQQEEYLFELPHKETVTLKKLQVLDASDLVVPYYSLQMSANGIVNDVMTDEVGCILLPQEWKESLLFEVRDLKTQISERYVIYDQQEIYIFQLPKETEEQNSYVRVVNQDNEPCPEYPLAIDFGDKIWKEITNESGIVHLGNLEVGSVFKVISGFMVAVQTSFEVEKGVDEYIFKITEEASPVTITLKDKNGLILPNSLMKLTNKRSEEFSHYTNDQGYIVAPYSFFTHNEKVKIHTEVPNMKVTDCRMKFVHDCHDYVVQLKDPFPWGCLWRLLLLLLFITLLFVKCNKDITIKTVDMVSNAIPGASVNYTYTEHHLYKNGEFFYEKVNTYSGITNNEGCVTFSNLEYSVFSWLFYNLSDSYAEGQKDGMVGNDMFFFYWQYSPFELVLKGNIQIQVRNRTTDSPISGANIKLICNDNGTDSLDLVTDANGECAFPYKSPDGIINRLLVTKSGYSGTLIKEQSFSQIISKSFIIYLDEPEPCSDQEANNEARDQGKNAVKDYDMKVEGGEFVLDYYTDSAPDIISVYDGSSAEYTEGTAKLIFNYNGATNNSTYSQHATVKFTSRIICVVVTGGSNWGYIVRCPN